MTIKGKISDLIHPKKEFKQLLRASESARKAQKDSDAKLKQNFKNTHIGHVLALSFYDENDLWVETSFIDHIDVCRKFTIIQFDKDCSEFFYWELDRFHFDESLLIVYYRNNTSIEVVRIS
jgi:hypothetical protein